MQESVELASVQLRGSPFTDGEDVLPTCYRCGSSNPPVNMQVSRTVSNTCRLLRKAFEFCPEYATLVWLCICPCGTPAAPQTGGHPGLYVIHLSEWHVCMNG